MFILVGLGLIYTAFYLKLFDFGLGINLGT